MGRREGLSPSPRPGAYTPGRLSVWPACHTVGSGSTPVMPGSQESVELRSLRAQRGWEGNVGHSAQLLDEGEAGQPAGSEHRRRHLAWEQPHLLGNLQRGEGRVSAVALATTLSHCNEAGRGRRLVLKEHEAYRFAFRRGLSRSSAPSQALTGTSSTGRTAWGRYHETDYPS